MVGEGWKHGCLWPCARHLVIGHFSSLQKLEGETRSAEDCSVVFSSSCVVSCRVVSLVKPNTLIVSHTHASRQAPTAARSHSTDGRKELEA